MLTAVELLLTGHHFRARIAAMAIVAAAYVVVTEATAVANAAGFELHSELQSSLSALIWLLFDFTCLLSQVYPRHCSYVAVYC